MATSTLRASKHPTWSLLMYFVTSLYLSVLCVADSSVTLASPSTSLNLAPIQTHTIQVGLADHKFQPDAIPAGIGDVVEFRFFPANHSVVRAEYGLPCVPYEMTGSNKRGFFSGFHPVDNIVDDMPSYSIRINDTSPVFFYCSAPGSCITYGMVGAINPNASTPITNQQQLARDSAYMLNPGEPFPPESPLPSASPHTISTARPTSGAKRQSLSAGVIAAIVVSVVVVSAALLGALLVVLSRRSQSPNTSSSPHLNFDHQSHITPQPCVSPSCVSPTCISPQTCSSPPTYISSQSEPPYKAHELE